MDAAAAATEAAVSTPDNSPSPTLSSRPVTNETNGSQKSLVEYWGSGVNFCGYCKRDESENSEGRRSYDMNAIRLTADDYQLLLDRNWRRSGNHCYNPLNISTCCPNYPISCEALKFKISKSQQRVVENLNLFLVTGRRSDQPANAETKEVKPKFLYTTNTSQSLKELESGDRLSYLTRYKHEPFDKIKDSSKARDRRFVKSCEKKTKLYNIPLEEAIRRTRDKALSKLPLSPTSRPSSLEQLLYPKKGAKIDGIDVSQLSTPKHKLEIKLHSVKSYHCEELRENLHKLMVKYQTAVHKDSEEDWTMKRYCDFLECSPLIIEPMKDFDYITSDNQRIETGDILSIYPESDSEEYLLVKPPELPIAYGTYHCTYLLDDMLIAVGVLDVLTKCVTTVYFFYDPDYSYLNLGVYSALIEISLVRRLARHYCGPLVDSRLKYYYMGFYVHECKKMHYKTRFKPSHLLCSETCRYIPTEICLEKLIGQKYARFDPNPVSANDINQLVPTITDIMDIPVSAPVIDSSDMTDYLRWLKNNLGAEYADLLINYLLVQYVKLIGRPLLTRICLQVNAVHRALIEKHRRTTMPNEATSSSTSSETASSSTSTSTS